MSMAGSPGMMRKATTQPSEVRMQSPLVVVEKRMVLGRSLALACLTGCTWMMICQMLMKRKMRSPVKQVLEQPHAVTLHLQYGSFAVSLQLAGGVVII